MRLRRRIFRPRVHTTTERGRPITMTLSDWLAFDLSVHDAQGLAQDLLDAIDDVGERQP